MTALTFMHIDAALSVLGLILLFYGVNSSPDDAPQVPSQNTLTNFVLLTFMLASFCTLIIYGGWIIA
ncbi:hypothetical protein [Methylobacterium pseudosasicola]|uniref:Uncharacterized protein n=1 Tax=Methylobacterium pseudosasicola TaxID=582667 RepID=A0A1I4U006_9HYPH|nr:hypothetical protein [Methylobacterium pseudosasicola]SFM82342.1 hypothetical protein SAMN05192568_106111 [Methylobacterium pseudosasicola]